jgi:hypothetical protein
LAVYMELAGMDGREHLMNGAWDGATLLCFELRIRFGTFFVGTLISWIDIGEPSCYGLHVRRRAK